MTALYFLLGALVISAIGSAIVVLRYRKPDTEDWSIEEFRREMQALSPEARRDQRTPPAGPARKPAQPARPTGLPGPAHRSGDRGR
jgi:hypothetical protein